MKRLEKEAERLNAEREIITLEIEFNERRLVVTQTYFPSERKGRCTMACFHKNDIYFVRTKIHQGRITHRILRFWLLLYRPECIFDLHGY